MREADLAASRIAPSEEFALTGGRLAAWPSLMMSQFLVPGASLVGHLCGLAAGVLHVYAGALLGRLRRRRRSGGGGRRLRDGRLVPALGPQDLGTGRHPGLGWLDVGSHVVLGVAACLAARYGGIAQVKR
jgi:rhomboid domain-containing protein 1